MNIIGANNADKATEEILFFVENSDCQSDIENNEDFANNDWSLLSENEYKFINKGTDLNMKLKKRMNRKKE